VYRGVRTAVCFNTRSERHQLILVTSPTEGDGKSTLCANLAISIAQSGKRVLLIDADCRRPRQHRLFQLSNARGLVTVITDDAELIDVIQPSCVANLSLLPCGPRPNNPGELLSSPRFAQLLEELRPGYDFILVDSPPLLAVNDPAVVAPRVDAVLLTLRLSRTCRPAAERATEMLTALGATVLGVVINGLCGRGHQGYQNYAYNYNYEYAYAYQPDSEGESGVIRDDHPNGGVELATGVDGEPSSAVDLGASPKTARRVRTSVNGTRPRKQKHQRGRFGWLWFWR
jgi:capsular exopolysaccharide synthesis family protein